MQSTYEEVQLNPKLTHFTLIPGHSLDDETVERTESELKKTGAVVETKTDRATTRYFFVKTSSPDQAEAVRETVKSLGYKDFEQHRQSVENS